MNTTIVKLMCYLCQHRETKLRTRYHKLDANHSGVLQLSEAKELSRVVFPELPELYPHVGTLFTEADETHNGQLRFSEFVVFYALLQERLVSFMSNPG